MMKRVSIAVLIILSLFTALPTQAFATNGNANGNGNTNSTDTTVPPVVPETPADTTVTTNSTDTTVADQI